MLSQDDCSGCLAEKRKEMTINSKSRKEKKELWNQDRSTQNRQQAIQGKRYRLQTKETRVWKGTTVSQIDPDNDQGKRAQRLGTQGRDKSTITRDNTKGGWSGPGGTKTKSDIEGGAYNWGCHLILESCLPKDTSCLDSTKLCKFFDLGPSSRLGLHFDW